MEEINFGVENGDIIQTIKNSVKTETIKCGADEYLTRPVHRPPLPNLEPAIRCATLTALVDYLNSNVDLAAREVIAVHVASPTMVEVVRQITNVEHIRWTALSVQADVPQINLTGRFQTQQNAMIELQSLFVQEGPITDLLRSIGNIVLDEEITQADDGVTQRVVAQSGVERAVKEIGNPVSLKPYRTFAEIEQPASPFVLRLKKEGGLQIALFEADGGKWRNTARQSIKEFLTENLNDEYPILA